MANFCSNCGTRLGEGARFCPNCGQKIGDSPDRNEPIRNNAPTAPVIEPKKAASGNGNRAAKPFGNANRAAKSYGKNRSAKKKKSRLSLVLAVIMAVEFLIAGFKYPGFFFSGKDDGNPSVTAGHGIFAGDPGDDTGKTADGAAAGDNSGNAQGMFPEVSVEEAMEALAGLSEEEMRELSPGDPRYIAVDITEEELQSIPPQIAAVSPEEPLADFGDVTVNMKPWNLDGEDTLLFRTVGTRRDETSGRTMQVYDFELASGKDAFPGVVEITMPRAVDGHADGVLYYNREKKEWEPTCYVISDDGRFYTLLTDHFCIYCTTASDFCLTETLSSDTGAGVFCAMTLEEGEKYALRNDMSPVINPGTASGTVDIGASAVGFGYNDLLRRIYVCDDRLTQLYLNDSDSSRFLRTIYAEGNLKETTCIDYGIASFCGARDQLDAINTVKGLMGSGLFKGANPFFAFSATAVCALKVMYFASKGEEAVSIFKECGLDAVSCVVALKGLAFTGGPVGAVLLSLTALGLYLLPKIITSEKYHDGTLEGETYRYYLNQYYQHPGTGKRLRLDGTGWADALVYELDHCDPKEADSAVNNLYESYLNSFWQLNAVDKYTVLMRYADVNHRQYFQSYWKELSPERVDEITNLARGLLRENTREIVKDVHLKKVTEYVRQMKNNLNKVTIPYLNTYIVINAKDDAVSTFDKSLYAIEDLDAVIHSDIPFDLEYTGNVVLNQEMVAFWGVKEPVFWPANMSRSLYSTRVFRPVFQKDSDLIFACRRYYYMMFGGPDALNFKGHPESGAPALERNIAVSTKQVGTIRIDVPLGDELSLDGDWWEEAEQIGQRVIRLKISEDGLHFRVNTDAVVSEEVITKDYTRSKDLLIFDAGKNLGGAVQIRIEDSRHISVLMDGTTRRFVKEDAEAAALYRFLGEWAGEAEYTDDKGKRHQILFSDTIAYGDGHIKWREVTNEEPNRTTGSVVSNYTLDLDGGKLTLTDQGLFKGGSTTYTLSGEDQMICINGQGDQYILKRVKQVNYVRMPVRSAQSGIGSGSVSPTGQIQLGGTSSSISLGGD